MGAIANGYKLLVLDIDGTLLNKSGAISHEDKKALAKVRASGIEVALSSGRASQACLSIIARLSLEGYHIFFDGALVSNPRTGHEVYAQPIDDDLVTQIIDFAQQSKIDLELFSSTSFFIERETWSTAIRRNFFGIEPTVIDFSSLKHRERIIKGTLVILSPEERAKADSLLRRFQDSLHFSWTKAPAYPEADFINILTPEVSKGRALESLVSFLGIPMDSVVAIGDGINDISLLSKAGRAVAMSTAPDEVKAVAHYVTGDVDHGGVATAINELLLRS
ncbi:MAG: HAD family phosphatase [Chloroflexi bacterium]|nr:HAD family phosphatase [Chloroflexota bacterium]